MKRTARYDQLMTRLASQVGMEPTSLDSVKANLDPFHDSELDPMGWPDLTTSPSVMQCLKQTLTIAAPSGITGAALWDCHIWNSPYVNSTAYPEVGPGNLSNKLTYFKSGTNPTFNLNAAIPADNSGAGNAIYGVNIWSIPTASNADPFITPTDTTHTMQHMHVDPRLNRGASRVFASGIEVHNTTSALNKQGSVLVYRQPLDDNAFKSTINIAIPQTYTVPTGTLFTQSISATDVLFVPSPPTSSSAALTLKGSRQWEAADGSYQVHGLHNVQLPCNGATFTLPSYYPVTPQDTTQYTTALQNSVVPSTGSGPTSFTSTPQAFWTEFDTSGAWYTGLSASTTLTINWNVYIERFPTQLDVDLCLLARPSPTYDVKALEFISVCSRMLPPGVMVSDNGTGDWFADLIQTGAEYVAPLLKMVPHPYAQGISTALTAGGSMVNAFRSKPKAERAAINNVAKAEIAALGASGGKKAKKVLRIVEEQSKVNNANRSRSRSRSRVAVTRAQSAPPARGRGRSRTPRRMANNQSPWSQQRNKTFAI